MAITFVAAGTVASGNGNLVVAPPAGLLANDILYLILVGENTAFGTPSGWTALQNPKLGTAGNANAIRLATFWKRTTGTESSITTSGGNVTFGVMLAYRGALLSGTPFRTGVNNVAGSTSSLTAPTISGLGISDTLIYAIATCNTGTITLTTNETAASRATGTPGTGRFQLSDTINNGSTSVTTPATCTPQAGQPVATAGSIAVTVDALIVQPINLTIGGTLGKLTGAASVKFSDYATIDGLLGSITGNASVDLTDEASIAGLLGSVTGAASVTFPFGVTVTGTLGSISGAASVALTDQVTIAGLLGSITGAIAILEEEDAVLAGTLAHLTGSASVALTDEATIAGLLGSLFGSGSIALTEQATIAGTLGSVFGAASVSFVEIDLTAAGTLGHVTGAASVSFVEIDLTAAGTLAALFGAAQVDLTDEATIAGLLGAVTGAIAILEEEDAVLAGTLGALTGAAEIELIEDVSIDGLLGALTGAAEVEVQNGVTLDGLLGALTGATEVDLVAIDADISGLLGSVTGAVFILEEEDVALAGLLGSVSGAAEVELSEEVTVDGLLGALFGAAEIELTLEVTVTGTLGAVFGAADIDSGEGASGDVTIAGMLGAVFAVAEVTLENDSTIVGLLGHVSGQVFILEEDDVVIAGLVPKVTGAGVIGLVQSINVPAMIPHITAAVNVTLSPFIEAHGFFARVFGMAQLDITGQCYDLSEDTRELILARLHTVLSTIPGMGSNTRNDPNINEDLLPAILMLDADEDADTDGYSRGRPAYFPNIVRIKPQVFVMAQGEPELVGRRLNEYQALVISAVLRDSTLLALCADGQAFYDGAEVAFANGRTMEGDMAINFTFPYVLRTPDICDPLPLPDDPWLPEEPTRERVLAAFARAISSVPGIGTFSRNELAGPEDALPAVMMLDGDEFPNAKDSGSGRPPHGPKRVTVEPELYVIVDGEPADVGPALNEIRLMIIRAVLNDALLTSLVCDGDIRYEGLQTGLALGRSMAGEMGLKFSTIYVLKP